MSDPVMIEIADAIATITLNNPAAHNSLGFDALTALRGALEDVAARENVRVLVVTGAGDKTFCSGASLADLRSGKITGDDFQKVTDYLSAMAVPTIAALNGSVYGGGTELALSCDFRIGITGMRVRVPPATMGLCYPVSGINTFVRKLGPTTSKRLLMAAETFTDQKLIDLGLVDRLVTAEVFQSEVQALALSLSNHAPLAVQGMKSIIDQVAQGCLDQASAQGIVDQCWQSKDLQEGLLAQLEKRPPRFKGH